MWYSKIMTLWLVQWRYTYMPVSHIFHVQQSGPYDFAVNLHMKFRLLC